ncbi:NAD(P)-binding protein [Marinobacter sp. BSs20148]|jgi:glycine/D-amino acid oxidase-like deaminating enzyme|uniref:NAD(P)-binding protein n=1 Tax=Marinobacter sp. BSs20148 TaxID=490759 RepID=UPI000A054D75
MKVLVLGGGVAGVFTAWCLAKSGHEITVVERNLTTRAPDPSTPVQPSLSNFFAGGKPYAFMPLRIFDKSLD